MSARFGSLPSARRVVLTAALAVAAVGCGGAPHEVLVSAAASLRPAIEEIGGAYRASGGDAVLVNTASSSSLARQIVAGAPVDLFISADERQMDAVEAAGRVAAGTRVVLLSNQLAVVAPADAPARLDSLDGLVEADVRRIGIGEPTAVPAGVYARELLTAKGLWERLQPKMVPGGSVETVLAAAGSGNVDVAFVYLTDAKRSRRVRTLLVVGVDEGPRIVYPAAVLVGGRNEAGARRFLEYLTRQGRAVFSRHGFGTP
jgi:molybdate transport system substrate-binding protein